MNVGKRGSSLSFGGRGLTTTISGRGTRATVGLPGTGLSYSSFTPHRRGRVAKRGSNAANPIIIAIGALFILAILASVLH